MGSPTPWQLAPPGHDAGPPEGRAGGSHAGNRLLAGPPPAPKMAPGSAPRTALPSGQRGRTRAVQAGAARAGGGAVARPEAAGPPAPPRASSAATWRPFFPSFPFPSPAFLSPALPCPPLPRAGRRPAERLGGCPGVRGGCVGAVAVPAERGAGGCPRAVTLHSTGFFKGLSRTQS